MELRGLRQARYRAALTQEELAQQADVSKPTIIDLERGRRKARPTTTRKLAHALGVAPEELMSGNDHRRPQENSTDMDRELVSDLSLTE
jgi:DNA-binding XRE family transcriptional regulator